MKGLATAWTQHLPPDRREEFEKLVRNSVQVFSRMRQILTEKEKALSVTETKLSEYENPAWSHKQAHINGRRAELKEIRELLNFLGP